MANPILNQNAYSNTTEAPTPDGLTACLSRIRELSSQFEDFDRNFMKIADQIGGPIPQTSGDPSQNKNPAPDTPLFMARAIENFLSEKINSYRSTLGRVQTYIA